MFSITQFLRKQEHPIERFPAWFWAILVVLALSKLFLVQAQAVTTWEFSGYDDLLSLRSACWLARGDWLGPYDHLTLRFGPFYGIWIALAFLLGLPLLLSEHLLYITACLLTILAVRPLFRRYASLIGIYTVMLFNPVSFMDGVASRVLRIGIYHSLKSAS